MTAPTRDEPMRPGALRRLMKTPDAPPKGEYERQEMAVRWRFVRGYLSTAPRKGRAPWEPRDD